MGYIIKFVPNEKVVEIEKLEPYFKIALETAKKSECLRRKYGAVIAFNDTDIRFIAGYNQRMNSRCCRGSTCVRNRMRVANGTRTEMGGEIHAETAALIQAGPKTDDSYFILAGIDSRGSEIFGKGAFPCHACAMAIKFAGYKWVYMHESENQIKPYSIEAILEERAAEWEPEI